MALVLVRALVAAIIVAAITDIAATVCKNGMLLTYMQQARGEGM